MMTTSEQMEGRRESRLRGFARRRGYEIQKSRRQLSLDQQGAYMLVQSDGNSVVLGGQFDATLDDIQQFLEGR